MSIEIRDSGTKKIWKEFATADWKRNFSHAVFRTKS